LFHFPRQLFWSDCVSLSTNWSNLNYLQKYLRNWRFVPDFPADFGPSLHIWRREIYVVDLTAMLSKGNVKLHNEVIWKIWAVWNYVWTISCSFIMWTIRGKQKVKFLFYKKFLAIIKDQNYKPKLGWKLKDKFLD